MAKIKWSALVSDVSKSLNGSTFARNRGGSYMRNKTTPVNPQTTFQSQFRNAFGAISSNWRGLSEPSRLSWNEGAVNFPYTDQFGDVRYLSGFSLHQKLNQNIYIATGSVNDLSECPAPVTVVPSATVSLEFGLDNDQLLLTVSETGISSQATVIRMTRRLSNGRYFVKNDYRVVTTTQAAIEDLDITSLYIARFGAFPADGTIGIEVYNVNVFTGQRSSSLFALVYVPAP